VVASGIVLAIPGPTILLVVSYALSHGPRSAFSTVPGVALGDLVAISLSFLGLGALLAASAEAFTLMKWAGAAYLVFLGIRMWWTRPDLGDVARPERPSDRATFTHAFAVTVLNPKSIAFFVAFLPQFLTANAPLLPQMLALGSTFVVLGAINAAVYAVVAGRLHGVARRPLLLRGLHIAGGSLLIGAGLMTAALRRPI
jgi:threonine/homoserine/homoserine lactone efflux protein